MPRRPGRIGELVTEPADIARRAFDSGVPYLVDITTDPQAAHPELSKVLVRTARPDEYDMIGRLTVEVYVGEGLIDENSPYVATLLDAADRAAKSTLLVAELAGAVVGAVAYCPAGTPYAELAGPGEAEFRMLAVRAGVRGNGVGATLVRSCLDRARDAGCTALRLSTQQNMRAAQRMYERFGFTRTAGRDWAPRPGIDLITYEFVF